MRVAATSLSPPSPPVKTVAAIAAGEDRRYQRESGAPPGTSSAGASWYRFRAGLPVTQGAQWQRSLGRDEACQASRCLGPVQVLGKWFGSGDPTLSWGKVATVGLIPLRCSTVHHEQSRGEGTSYNLREIQESEERQWRSQIEHRISAMTEIHQKAIKNLTFAHDQRNDGVAGHAPIGQGPDPSLAPIHKHYPIEKGVDSVTASAAAAIPIVDGENEACRRGRIQKEFMKYDVPHTTKNSCPYRHRRAAAMVHNPDLSQPSDDALEVVAVVVPERCSLQSPCAFPIGSARKPLQQP
ncbi:hypothetical protein Scep_021706 [Stephania cephalantha]|uniref:Uncharacterized protein n=1 Tax=Stephania cephalantha TaxID=152367 RepID=A0AAP0I0F7_9MAGN